MFFLELSCVFDDPAHVGNLISGSSAFSKTSLNIWKFMVHVFLKPGLENFEHYFTSMWDECNCAVVWAFFGIAFLWDWNENWPFPVLSEQLHFHFSLACIGEGNGNPLYCSCLENPRAIPGGAWWAAVYGVAQSRTRLKWLSRKSINFGDGCRILNIQKLLNYIL